MSDEVAAAAQDVLDTVDEIGWEGLASWVVPEAVESVRPDAYGREFEVGIPELWAEMSAGWEHDDRL